MRINKLKKEFTIEQWEAVIGVCAIEKIYKELLMRYIQLMYELVHHPYRYNNAFNNLQRAFQSLTQSLPYKESVVAPILELRDKLFPSGTRDSHAGLQAKSELIIQDSNLYKLYMKKVTEYTSIVSEVEVKTPYTVSEALSYKTHKPKLSERYDDEEVDDPIVDSEEVYSLIRRVEQLRRVESENIHYSLANTIGVLESRILYLSYTDKTEKEIDIFPRRYYHRLFYKTVDNIGGKCNFTKTDYLLSVKYDRKDVEALLEEWRHTHKGKTQDDDYRRIFQALDDYYFSWIEQAPNKKNVSDFASWLYRTQLPMEDPNYMPNYMKDKIDKRYLEDLKITKDELDRDYLKHLKDIGDLGYKEYLKNSKDKVDRKYIKHLYDMRDPEYRKRLEDVIDVEDFIYLEELEAMED